MELNSTVLYYLASVTVRSLGLAVVAFAAVLLFRIKTAAALHAVFTVVVAGMLALAALSAVLPPLPLRVLREAGPPERGSALSPPATGVPDLPATPMQIGIPTGPPTSSLWPLTSGAQPSWQQVAVVAYGAGVLAFLIRLAFSYLFTRRLVRASRTIDRPWATGTYESSWISVPLTVGWLRPRILLPLGWDEWEEPKLQAVMAHERTHVGRGDWAIAVLAGLNRCVFWFNPLAWWLERRLAFLAEQACDDSALLQVGTEPYAQALLEMAAAVKAGQGRLVWEAMAMANVAEVRLRIERILDETRQIPKGLTRSRWVALLACSVPLVYMASVIQLAPAQVQQVRTPTEINELLKGKRQLGPGDVSAMEQYLKTNPHDLDVRSQLVLYYFANGMREPRLSHILWLIANHPESNQAVFTSKGITPRTTALNDASDYTRAASLWKQQVTVHSTDTRVLLNAAEFLSQPGGDFDEAERLLMAAHKVEPTSVEAWNKLGRLYTAAIVGSAGDPHYPNLNPTFADRVKLQLENSTDGPVLNITGRMLAAVAQRPQPGRSLPEGVMNLDEHPMLIPVVEMGNRLIARSQQFGQPGIAGSIDSAQAALLNLAREQALSNAGAPIRVDNSWPSGQAAPSVPPLATVPPLITKVEPVYPPLARQARIQSDVRLNVTIGTDGHVQHIQVIMGHPLLVLSALEAVKQWVFGPIAAAGTIQITVPFRLDGGSTPLVTTQPAAAFVPPAAPTLATAPPLISKVDPVYSPLARQARIQGDVRLMLTIGTDGHIQKIEVVSGHPLMVPAALEAVKQWVYAPIPVAGTAQISVPFRLDGGDAPLGTITPQQAMDDKGGKASGPPSRIKIGGMVQAAMLISKVEPIYPDQARAAGIEGNVQLEITVGEDGHVLTVDPKDGHPLLAAAAADAVKQWVYRPTLLNGQPVTVITTVTVPFQLN